MRVLRSVNRALERVSGVCLALAILSITLLLCVNVIGRKVFGFSFPWAEELTNYTIIWITLVGGGLCVRRGLHVSVDILPNYLSPVWGRYLELVIGALGLIFSLILAYLGAQLAWSVVKSGQLSPALMLPMYLPYGALVVGGLFMALEYLENIAARLGADLHEG